MCFSSLSQRGQKVQEQILEEMKLLCRIIQTNGQQQDNTISITFGDLFEVNNINFRKISFIVISFVLDLYEYF